MHLLRPTEARGINTSCPDWQGILSGASRGSRQTSMVPDAFTGFLQVLEGKVQDVFWSKYGRTYCLKIARDVNLPDSRTDCYQSKTRLNDARSKWDKAIEGFASMDAEIQSTYKK